MNKLKNSLRRLKYRFKHNFWTVDNIVLIVAIVLCFTWTYQSIVAMSRNWALSEKLTERRKELELLELEVETIELENEYLGTSEYQELMARRNLDKQVPGEHLVVMPENSEEAKNKHKDVDVDVVGRTEEEEKSNFEKWMTFLFPRF